MTTKEGTMRRLLSTSLVGTLLFVCPVSTYLSRQAPISKSDAGESPAVRYYITTKAMLASPEAVSIFGASNLPPGSVLFVYIYDYIGEGSTVFNEETPVRVGEDGLFKVVIHPKEGLSLRTNLVCAVDFMPTDPSQPESVTKVVGAVGEYLGSRSTNPQIEGNSRITTLGDVTVVRD
jgi:hypothetical protein